MQSRYSSRESPSGIHCKLAALSTPNNSKSWYRCREIICDGWIVSVNNGACDGSVTCIESMGYSLLFGYLDWANGDPRGLSYLSRDTTFELFK